MRDGASVVIVGRMTTELYALLARYAERFHAVIGDGHHVASPLGAWLLLGLCGPASAGGTRDELVEVLGTDPTTAAAAAAALLDNPHPLVPSASAVWHRPGYDTTGLSDWRATLPRATEIGPVPEQAGADAWARERTLGLIEQFPVDLSEAVLVLANALATRVSWAEPFRIAPASTLGPDSVWATRLTRVLRSPEYGHRAFIATTKRAGDVIVHVAQAKTGDSGFAQAGLSVASVAAAPDVPAGNVLAAAYELAPTVDRDYPPGRRSLFDLPLGTSPLWTIREERVWSHAVRDGREERHSAVLPCWSANSTHDLRTRSIGFPAAAAVLAILVGSEGLSYDAKQAAMARYSRYGFEAAAVTAIAVQASAPPEGVARIAELRFGHPYAVVAVATDARQDADDQSVPGPWHGVPVFSAWVSEPEDLPEAETVDVTRRSRG
jgi:hypothetical protein